MSYKAGDLSLSIETIDTTSQSIDIIINRLNKLRKSINLISEINVDTVGAKITTVFNAIQNFLTGIDDSKIVSLSNFSKSLNSLTKLEKISKLNFSEISQGFNSLTTAITPFLNRLDSSVGSLNALSTVIQKSGKISKFNSNNNKNSVFNTLRLGAVIALTRRLASTLKNVVKYGVDYTETLNMWQVSMKDNLSQAEEFVNKMNKAYGISKQTLMNAQAVFKNMLGSLGGISDQVAYTISEAVTQMATDYSSLYNVELEDAFTKFQAALAGQVRPIRSVSGYDITENTLYQLYQTLGGTKTMRNLTQTEKRLLSIYAIFTQMEASGALGDMSKTLDQFANQSRMISENWKTLKTWAGLTLQYFLQTSGVLKYINAVLITASTVMEVLARSMGYTDPDFALSWSENIEETNKEIDKLTGKLLDFDKIRSLNSSSQEESNLVDSTVLKAISGYVSTIDNAKNSAQELANKWLEILGITTDENGQLVVAKNVINDIKSIVGIVIGSIATLAGIGIVKGIIKIVKWLLLANNALKMIAGVGIGLLIINLSKLIASWNDLSTIEKINGILYTMGSAALVAAAGIAALKGAWTSGLAAIAIIGGLTAIMGAIQGYKSDMEKIKFAANGASDIDGGTLFVAGEMGKTEAVYSGSNGKSNVANIGQLKNAFYQALVEFGKNNDNNVNVVLNLDGETVYKNTTAHAKRRGEFWAK